MARMHDAHPREALDKVVLFLAFAVGAGGTIILKMYPGVPPLAVALFPVVVLVFYVVACLNMRSIGTEPETIGDNSYYLGFLFTLASLAVTLYRIKDVGGADVDLIPDVISGFGVALSSTIAGVFLRVFLLQLRPDIVARDREARRDLSAGARDLREAVAAASRQLKTIAVETQQHVAERNGRMSEVLEIQVDKTSELLERQGRAYDQVIKDFGSRLTEEVAKALQKETMQAGKEINAAAKAFAENLSAMAQARSEAEADLVSSISTFQKVVSETHETSSRHSKFIDASYRHLADQSKKTSQSLQEASDSVQTAVTLSRQVIEETQRAVGSNQARMREDEIEFRRHTKAVTQSLLELEAVLSERIKELARLQVELPRPRQIPEQSPASGPALPDQPISVTQPNPPAVGPAVQTNPVSARPEGVNPLLVAAITNPNNGSANEAEMPRITPTRVGPWNNK